MLDSLTTCWGMLDCLTTCWGMLDSLTTWRWLGSQEWDTFVSRNWYGSRIPRIIGGICLANPLKLRILKYCLFVFVCLLFVLLIA